MSAEDKSGPGPTQAGQTQPGPTRQWTAVVRAVQTAQERVLAEAAHLGMPAQWFAVSQLLLEAPGQRMPMSKIAHDLSMTTGGFTKLADRLAREGLIDRRGAAGDRRVIFATLTDRGLQLARAGAQAYAGAIEEQILAAISATELDTLAEITGRLGRDASTPDAADGGSDDEPFVAKDRPPASPERRGRGAGATVRRGQVPRT